jgi:hypothetical protein
MKDTSFLRIFILIQLGFLALSTNSVFTAEGNSEVIPNLDKTKVFPAYNLEKFTIIVLPDTQYYSEEHPWIFDNQTEWILENIELMNIVFVTHLGDIVDHWWIEDEFENANNSLSKLDGNIPYGVLPGNHDGAEEGGDFYYYNTFFGIERYTNEIWYGGAYHNINTNSFQLFSAGGDDFLIFHLQNNPSNEILAWAGNIIDHYPTRRVIVSTHYYIEWSYQGAPRSEVGNRIWEKLVKPHADQIFLVLSGHVERERVRTDWVDENAVVQMVSDYQDRTNGGNGYLRILTFSPIQKKIFVKTFSPYLNRFEEDSDSEFSLDYNLTATQTYITIKSNSTISDFDINHQQQIIDFSVTGEEATMGYCNVTIPKTLFGGNSWKYPKYETVNYFKTYENRTHRTIYLVYNHKDVLPITLTSTLKKVETLIIPEFNSNLLLVTIILTLTIIISRKVL